MNFIPSTSVLIYAGEDGASLSVNKKTRVGSWAPRLGHDLRPLWQSTTILRTGFGITYYPEQPSASNMIGQQVPYTISQNVNFATNPTDFIHGPDDRGSVPCRSSRSNRARPRNCRRQTRACSVIHSRTKRRTPSSGTWGRAARAQAMAVESTYAGSAGKHMVFCYNPNEVQPGITSQELRRLIQPLNRLNNMLQCDPRNRSTYHSGQLKVTQRFSNGLQFLLSYTYSKSLDYGGSAASGGGAVGNPQTITNSNAGHGPSGFDVRHRAVMSGVWELPRTGPALASRRRSARRDRRRMAARRDWDIDDRPALHRVHADRRQQRRAELAEPDRFGDSREPNGRPRVQPGGLRSAAREHLRRLGAASCTARTRQRRYVALKRFTMVGRTNLEFRWDAFNLFNHPGFGFPNQNFDSPTAGTDHVDDRRQPVDAVFL